MEYQLAQSSSIYPLSFFFFGFMELGDKDDDYIVIIYLFRRPMEIKMTKDMKIQMDQSILHYTPKSFGWIACHCLLFFGAHMVFRFGFTPVVGKCTLAFFRLGHYSLPNNLQILMSTAMFHLDLKAMMGHNSQQGNCADP